jgi:hypothetical protein
MVALGGGGYNLSSTCRMWATAAATLCGIELPREIPTEFADKYHIRKLFDESPPDIARNDLEFAKSYAHRTIEALQKDVLSLIGKS